MVASRCRVYCCGQASSTSILDRVGDEGLVNALRSRLEQNRDVNCANACLGDGGSLHRVQACGAAVELVELGAEGGVCGPPVSVSMASTPMASMSRQMPAQSSSSSPGMQTEPMNMTLKKHGTLDLSSGLPCAHPLVVGGCGRTSGSRPADVLSFFRGRTSSGSRRTGAASGAGRRFVGMVLLTASRCPWSMTREASHSVSPKSQE